VIGVVSLIDLIHHATQDMADEEPQNTIDDNQQDETPGALEVIYCEVCSFPPEVEARV
jgi:hypothetical protein